MFSRSLGLTPSLFLLLFLSPSISGSDSHFRVSGMLDSRHGIPRSWQGPTIKGAFTVTINSEDVIFVAHDLSYRRKPLI